LSNQWGAPQTLGGYTKAEGWAINRKDKSIEDIAIETMINGLGNKWGDQIELGTQIPLSFGQFYAKIMGSTAGNFYSDYFQDQVDDSRKKQDEVLEEKK
jgi:hypothetical protein